MRNRGLLLETSREKFFQETRLQGALVSAGGRTDNCATGVTVGKIKERFYRFIWEIHDLKRAGLSLLFGGAMYAIGWRLGWGWELSFLCGWIVALTAYLVLVYIVIFTADAQVTRKRVSQVDPTRWLLLIVLTLVALLGNMSVAVILTAVGHRSALHARLLLSLSVVAVVLSWLLLHTTFPRGCAGALFSRGRQSPRTKIFSMSRLP